jgi:hypothetical protein
MTLANTDKSIHDLKRPRVNQIQKMVYNWNKTSPGVCKLPEIRSPSASKIHSDHPMKMTAGLISSKSVI